eukprot:Sdes_comp13438_c0_seq1m3193
MFFQKLKTTQSSFFPEKRCVREIWNIFGSGEKRKKSNICAQNETVEKTPQRKSSVKAETEKKEEKPGLLNQILHGTEKFPVHNVKVSHSQIVSCENKSVFEFEYFDVMPSKWDQWENYCSKIVPQILQDSSIPRILCGAWFPLVGKQQTSIFLWKYPNGYQDWDRFQKMLIQKTGSETMDGDKTIYREFYREIRQMILQQNNNLCLQFDFSQFSPPINQKPNIYELRSYSLKSGSMLPWAQGWSRGIQCRKQVCHPVGAWFSQLGDLNSVYHMWSYRDLDTRKSLREAAWEIDGWAETVYQTVPLIQSMRSAVLCSHSYSPIQ